MCNQRSVILPTLFAPPPNDGGFGSALATPLLDSPLSTLFCMLLDGLVRRLLGIGRARAAGHHAGENSQQRSNAGGAESTEAPI